MEQNGPNHDHQIQEQIQNLIYTVYGLLFIQIIQLIIIVFLFNWIVSEIHDINQAFQLVADGFDKISHFSDVIRDILKQYFVS